MKTRTMSWCCVLVLCMGTACEKKGPEDEVPTESPQVDASAAPTVEPTPDASGAAAEGDPASVEVVPLQHASMLLRWEGLVIAVDPVGDALEAAEGDEAKADLVLVTDIHGDHFDAEAVNALRKDGAPLIVPAAVAEQGGDALVEPTVLANGESRKVLEDRVEVEAVAMYNTQRMREDSGEPYHVKGRGNGYLLTLGSTRVYISGDTECIPEMKALEDVDVAFVCMNLPYTMTVEEAAECIAAFQPDVVYPYHHRGQDPSKLNELLAEAPDVKVELLDWYPEAE